MSRPTVDTFPAALLGHIADPTTNRAKDELAKAGADVSRLPDVRGVMLTVTIASLGSTRVAHKLGVVPSGYRMHHADAANLVYETSRSARHLTLANPLATSITFDVWVYA